MCFFHTIRYPISILAADAMGRTCAFMVPWYLLVMFAVLADWIELIVDGNEQKED